MPTVPPPTDLVVRTGAQYRDARKRMRRSIALIFALFAITCGGIITAQFQIRAAQKTNAGVLRNTNSNTRDIKESLHILRTATSPEAAAAQQAQLRIAIEAISCDNRAALQDLLDQLIARGILEPGDATINCTEQIVPTTTTPEN